MTTVTPADDSDTIADLTAAITLGKKLATQARADLQAAIPILVNAISHRSGQSVKLERILWSCWNDDHTINLCDALSGLDAKLAQAAVSVIAARAYCGGDVDDLLRKIIKQSGIQQPT
jgi:hypothetical protein